MDFDASRAIRTLRQVGFQGVSVEELQFFVNEATSHLLKIKAKNILTDPELLIALDNGALIKAIKIYRAEMKEAGQNISIPDAKIDMTNLQKQRKSKSLSLAAAKKDSLFIHYMNRGQWGRASTTLGILTGASPAERHDLVRDLKVEWKKNDQTNES